MRVCGLSMILHRVLCKRTCCSTAADLQKNGRQGGMWEACLVSLCCVPVNVDATHVLAAGSMDVRV